MQLKMASEWVTVRMPFVASATLIFLSLSIAAIDAQWGCCKGSPPVSSTYRVPKEANFSTNSCANSSGRSLCSPRQ